MCLPHHHQEHLLLLSLFALFFLSVLLCFVAFVWLRDSATNDVYYTVILWHFFGSHCGFSCLFFFSEKLVQLSQPSLVDQADHNVCTQVMMTSFSHSRNMCIRVIGDSELSTGLSEWWLCDRLVTFCLQHLNLPPVQGFVPDFNPPTPPPK